MNFSAVILAGGKSSRMGRDKAWLEIDGETLLGRQIKLVRAAGASEVLISGRADQDYSQFSCPLLTDHFPDAGPLAGIESALRVCHNPLLLVLAVDMPFMSAALLQTLVAQGSETCGVIPEVAGHIEPLAAFYPQASRALASELLSSPGRTPGAGVLANRCIATGLATILHLTAADADYFRSWNSPADVEARNATRATAH